MPRRRFGLHGRLVLVQLGVFALLLFAAGLMRYVWLEQAFLDELDRDLRSSGLTLRERVSAEYGTKPDSLRPVLVRLVNQSMPAGQAVLAIDDAGIDLAASESRSGMPSIRSIDPRLPAGEPVTVRLQGVPVRAYRIALPEGLSVIFTHSLQLIEGRLTAYLWILGWTTLVILVLGGVVSWYASRIVLKPITMVALAAQRLGGDLREGAASLGRIPKAPGDDVVATLTKDFNQLLAALEIAVTRERRTANRFRLFLADAAHELRTPIAIIRAEAESAQADPSPNAQHAALALIASEAAHLGAIVGDLMMLARRDAGGQAPRTRVFLDDIAASAMARLSSHPLAEGRQLRLGEFEAAPVMGDRETLERAIVILVHNALVHAAPSPIELSTGVHFGSLGSTSWVRVRDWGAGIPMAQQDRIFDRFARLDHSRPGTGLGLAIARTIAEEFDGTLTIESEVGRGAAFLLELPCADDAPDAAQHPEQLAEPAPALPT